MWRIWYANGSAVDSETTAPADVPGHGALIIAQPDDREGVGNVGYLTLSGDYFYWRTDVGRWYPASGLDAVMDLVLHREPIVGICQGRYIPHARFQAILADAKQWASERGLPEKSGFRSDERP